MASHAPDFARAEALPLAAVLSSARSYPRPVVERLVARLIDHLDEHDGDPDLEPNGDELDGSASEEDWHEARELFRYPGCPISDPGEENGDKEPDHYVDRLSYPIDQRLIRRGEGPGRSIDA